MMCHQFLWNWKPGVIKKGLSLGDTPDIVNHQPNSYPINHWLMDDSRFLGASSTKHPGHHKSKEHPSSFARIILHSDHSTCLEISLRARMSGWVLVVSFRFPCAVSWPSCTWGEDIGKYAPLLDLFYFRRNYHGCFASANKCHSKAFKVLVDVMNETVQKHVHNQLTPKCIRYPEIAVTETVSDLLTDLLPTKPNFTPDLHSLKLANSTCNNIPTVVLGLV